MSAHTPGPWEVHAGEHGPISIDTVRPKGETVVAVVYFRPTYRPSAADCALLAAAPDLLEVCAGLVRWDNTPEEFLLHGFRELLTKARAAIAKAEGK